MSEALARAYGGSDEFEALLRFHDRISDRLHADEPSELLRHMAAGAVDALGADRALVAVLNPQHEEIVAIGVDGTRDDNFTFQELMSGQAAQALETDRPLVVAGDDLKHPDLGSLANFLDGLDSAAFSPLRFDDQLIGALVIGRAGVPFDDGVALIMEAMADQAGIVLGYALRLRSEQRQRRLADTLRDVTAAMASTLDLRGVLDGVLEGLDEVMPYDTSTLMLRQDDSMHIMASRGFDSASSVRGTTIPIESDPTIQELLTNRSAVIVTDWTDRPRGIYVGDVAEVGGFIAVPLMARNRVIGVLTVASFNTAYSLAESVIADAFADHAAVAIQNARLFQRTQASLARAETLYRVAQALIAGSALEETLQAVVDGVAEAIPADRVSLMTVNPRKERIIHFVRGGPGRDRIVAVGFDELWDGLGGHVMREREPATSSGTRADEREGPLARARRDATGAGAVMAAPLQYRGKVFGVLNAVNRTDQAEFGRTDLILLEAMANQAAIAIENARLFDEVQRLAVTDDLTGLSNRRGFFELARRELERAERTHRPLSVLMLDIDRFKNVNDTYGHAVGDEVLRHLADRCRHAVRDIDLVGRYGGEEFSVLLPETNLKTAHEVAERIRASIADAPFDTAVGPLPIKVSVGLALATNDGEESIERLLDRADSAMYLAKQRGGDAVESLD